MRYRTKTHRSITKMDRSSENLVCFFKNASIDAFLNKNKSIDYKLQELPPNATSRQQQHWRDQSIKTNNDMLHKIWAAISRIRPCRCQKDDVVHRDNSPSTSGSGSSGTHRVRKRSMRPNDAGTSEAGDEE
ncbi:hypothetical protein Bca101_076203 [Brassica carinata]